MGLINSMFKGMIGLSFILGLDYGCSVKNMATNAVDAHKKGLTSYGSYSRMLTSKSKAR